ncbi:protease [Longispora fulva]|uniref:microbial collagenase n=1 Tax=Longispora fulva TaxID=619741 RepID=A0A8J7GDQ2_9ACTN|nr:collagenase [Longispora fulva]MBG6136794.1 microbial collagenase [Longispora fulva]GIG59965.1 protease [Longispora fulva]
MRKPLSMLAAVLIAVGMASPAAAAPQAPTRTKAPSASAPSVSGARTVTSVREPAHRQARPLTPDRLPPTALTSRQPEPVGRGTSLAASCTAADFSSRTGAALVSYVKASDVMTCINTLFSVAQSQAYGVFNEAQMTTIATAYRTNAQSYPGNNSTGTEQLVLFLRAGWYVQEQYPSTIPAYSAALTTAHAAALDAFFANPRSSDVNDANGEVLGESIILTDSAMLQHRYIALYKRMLTGYTSAYDPYYYMLAAVNDVYIPIFRGHWNAAYVTAVTSDPSLIDTLYAFARDHLNLLGGDWSVLATNAGAETARFLWHDATRVKTRPLAKGLLDRSSITGPTAGLWVAVAGQADYYDRANCSYYGTCDLANRLADAALPIRYNCDAGHTIWAQDLTSAELTATCTSVRNQDAYFHAIVADSGPVANDNNTNIRINVFNSSSDYRTYAGVIFNISTNNGGMYLEGDPAVAGNQANFVAYEAEWQRPTFAIWNLNHEYTHYLDGRYDTYGDFNAGQVVPDIWWIEGFAEYVSYSYRGVDYDDAIAEAGNHTYALSTLWQTTYANTNQTRTYNWGYLAVRYMLEKHRSDVLAILAKFRVGDYQGGYAYYSTTIGNRYDADFAAWLTACNAGACRGNGGVNQPPVAAFDAAVSGLTVNLTDRSTDSDGAIASRSWTFGDGGTSTAANPSRTYAAAGTYTVTLSVTDDKGATASTSRAVTVGGTQPCTDPNTQAMDRNCSRANRSATAGNLDYLWIYLPAGTTTLRVTTSGGTGNADLYYNPNTWATSTAYTARSTNAGNTETLTVTNTTAGYRYISLYAVTAFSGVTVTTSY